MHSRASAAGIFLILGAASLLEFARMLARQSPPAGIAASVVVSAALAAVHFVHAVVGGAVLLMLVVAGLGSRGLAKLVYFAVIVAGYRSAFALGSGSSGYGAIWLALFVTWANDVGAYFAGIRFGRRRLAPTLSPKKSWEGALGGMAASILVGALVGFFLVTPELGAAAGLLAGFFGPAGDLVESSLKRGADLKDSSGILPGHGGVLDRFDAFMVNAVAAECLRGIIPF